VSNQEIQRILGIDYGERRIGIAVSDPTRTIATAVKTLPNKPDTLKIINQIAIDYAVSEIVVGLPLTLKGTDSEKTKEVRLFKEKLEQLGSIPVLFEDERLSTRQAASSLLFMNTTRKQRRDKGKVDQMAAALILQSYLDRTRQRE
jgi:putative holliday junction resolvase